MADKIRYPSKPIENMDISKFRTMKTNWEFSAATLGKINERLNKSLEDEEISVAVAGSYGRLEASPNSDLDFIILSQHELEDKKVILNCIKNVVDELSIGPPNLEGVFSEVISVADLVDKVGSRDDTLECRIVTLDYECF